MECFRPECGDFEEGRELRRSYCVAFGPEFSGRVRASVVGSRPRDRPEMDVIGRASTAADMDSGAPREE